jgi:tagatose-1,6-bisphosphate aldolase non-catalytic subunit AgaZ/GatZ
VKGILDIVARHKQGERVGVYSLCSAHPQVVECALREAQAFDAPLLVEATSNQVNQFGGYTGMRPAIWPRASASPRTGCGSAAIISVRMRGGRSRPNPRWRNPRR